MSLQQRLDAMRAKSGQRIPPDIRVIMDRAREELNHSGIVERALGSGTVAPEFALLNADGREIRSRDLLARGPLIVNFYRGKW